MRSPTSCARGWGARSSAPGSSPLGPPEPEDFVVEELPLYLPRGEGHHTFLEVEKRLRTTEEVARALARAAGVPSRDVGYAGRKDRQALTRQWFSVPGLAPEDAVRLDLPGARVLSAARHPHKLRTGQLRGNRFALRLRGLDEAAGRAARGVLERLFREGMPNRFGAQRFGRDGDNAALGLEVLLGRRSARGREARFLVSALQAAVFNLVLEQRPRPLVRLEAGDLAVRHVSGGIFTVVDPAVEQPRADAFEISASGPVPGSRAALAEGVPGERERAALAELGVDAELLARPPRGLRLRGARRTLRVRPEAARLEPEGESVQVLHFTLPPGSYATVLVEEVLAACGLDTPWPGPRPGAPSARGDVG